MRKLTFLVFTFFFTGLLYGQDQPESKYSINHLAISVKDVNRSAEFYSTVLKLPEITNRSKMEGIRWFRLGDQRELHLVSIIKENVTINKALHFGFTTDNFDAFQKNLIALKIPYSDWAGKPNTVNIRADGIKQIFFQDPDGYWIEVNSLNDPSVQGDLAKNEVWQLEENYWKYVKEKNLDAYLSLWDVKFIGYPSNNTIVDKKHITDWITEMYKGKAATFSYALTRKVENVFDDIVIVLYDVTQTWTNDKKEIVETSNIKITHTWKKTDKGWVIIGGMGAVK